MSRSKSFCVILIFLVFSLTTLSIVYINGSESATDGSRIIPIGITSRQLDLENSSQVNAALPNSYVTTNITLGKGRPLSMAMDFTSNLLYIVSPSDVDRNVRNLIYVIDSNENKVIDTIKVGSADHDFLRDVAIDSSSGMIYATGEYRVEESGVTYENDSIYFIDPKTKQSDRISVYGEPEEGKEGDLSKIAVDPSLKLIYVGSLYPEGGMPGLYVVDPAKKDVITMMDKWESGVSEVLVDSISHQLIVTAKYDNLVSLMNASTREISKNVSIVDPVATSWNPEGSIYVATGSGNISVIDPISGKVNNHFVGSSVQDLSSDPKARMLYITSINKTVQLTPNSSEPVGKLMVMNPTTGVANVIFQSDAALTKAISNPSSGTVYVLGYDDKNSKLFILKPQLS